MIALLGTIVVLFCMFTSTIWRGYVISVLWSWFVVTTFKQPELSVPLACGLACVTEIFRGYRPPPTPDPKKEFMHVILENYVAGLFYSAILLGIGAIVRLFL